MPHYKNTSSYHNKKTFEIAWTRPLFSMIDGGMETSNTNC
jgi:hypothetical protein